METFEVPVKDKTYRIVRNNSESYTFSVFNHATFHIIRKNNFGIWNAVEHRFGAGELPLEEIGDAIDKHYDQLSFGTAEAS